MCKDTDARKSTAVLGKATLCARREGAWLVKERQNKIAVETEAQAGWDAKAETLSGESGLHAVGTGCLGGF